MSRVWMWVAALGVLAGVGLSVPPCLAESNKCGSKNEPWTYHAQGKDISTSTRLDVARELSAPTHLIVDVCQGELHIVPSPETNILRLQVKSPGADKPLGEYLQRFDVKDGEAVIKLQAENNAHPVVTLYVPAAKANLESEINLGAGALTVTAADLPGDRVFNVGAGSITLTLDRDRNYVSMKINIGMGHLKDERPQGRDSTFIVSRKERGNGHGEMQLNLGAGIVDLKQDTSER